MKQVKYGIVVLALFIVLQVLTSCTGYIVATAPPAPPDEVIIVAPSPSYVWVPGYYSYSGGAYIWVQGSYRIPPRGKTTYVQSQWHKTPKGYKRSKGYWK